VGKLLYGGQEFEFADRTLAHIQIVIGVKLRRSENFVLTWAVPANAGGGRYSVWLDNGVPIGFRYSGGRVPSINREWLETMLHSASSTSGMTVTDEGIIAPAPGELGIPID